MEINEAGKTAQKGFSSFLSNKPIWAFWIAYIILSGVLFGIFYTAMYLMSQLWWIPIIVIIAIGIIWGTLAYPKVPKEKKLEEKE